MMRMFPDTCLKNGWDSAQIQRAYSWALRNQKTAWMFWLCDDLTAFRKAHIYGLEDDNLPFDENQLTGIAEDPARAVGLQWKVMLKELPQTGAHVEYSSRDRVPLRPVDIIDVQSPAVKGSDKVRWLDSSDDRVYARKWIVCDTSDEKKLLLQQLQDLKKIKHPNIANIVATYAQGHKVFLITHMANCSLESYFQLPSEQVNSEQVLTWITDLTHALEYLHEQKMQHRNIRPRKILIDGTRIYFATFGLCNSENGTPRTTDSRASAQEKYIYAAPETTTRRKSGRSGDIFSLGCIFANMMTLVKGQTVFNFQSYRSRASHDSSFQANTQPVSAWMQHLMTLGGLQRRGERTVSLENDMLALVERMLPPEPAKRIKTKKL
ncbi:kinase-like protein, partial [Aulographum hederae CBS 113979]